MSVQCNTYAMLGAIFNYDELKKAFADDEDAFYENFEPYTDNAFKGIEGKDGITVLFDGMNGKVAVPDGERIRREGADSASVQGISWTTTGRANRAVHQHSGGGASSR